MIQAVSSMLNLANTLPSLFAQANNQGISTSQYIVLAAVAATLILPFVFGRAFAKGLKMPTYGPRIGWIILALAASIIVLVFGELKYGVDIRGGTILVYELDPAATLQRSADEEGSRVTAADLIPSLTKRINPSGTEDNIIRPYGDAQIEIIIPAVQEDEVNAVKRQITEAGILRFAIVANTTDHNSLIQSATSASQSTNRAIALQRNIYGPNDRLIGFWADVDRETPNDDGIAPLRVEVGGAILRNPENGAFVRLPMTVMQSENPNLDAAIWLKDQGIPVLQVLMVVNENLRITGEDLSYVARGVDPSDGSPSVRFSLKDGASSRFFRLTSQNAPEGSFKRRLGIVLDDRLLSAPQINDAISGDGTISGRFTGEEVDYLVNILRAGQLPAALNKVPISENRIGSTLGADTIIKGMVAIGVSLVMVLLFVIVYYRFTGLIACFALVMNLLMIVAMMILINQPITLPGLAGLVLTVGMSVDANVLIFERIREEIRRGAAPRMAVRNGFSRATTTIVDANLTTLITAIVLYAIGTDQIRGFAVTLILGILFSMFTAIYVARTLFDIAERRGFLSLSMSDMVTSIRNLLTGNRDFDFMGKGTLAMSLSTLLIVIGIGALVFRGADILDIDFAGGSSVTFQLNRTVPADEVRDIVTTALADPETKEQTPFTLNKVNVEGADDETVYKVDASFDDDEILKQKLQDGFAKLSDISLVAYRVQISSGTGAQNSTPATGANPGPGVNESGKHVRDNGIRLVSLQAAEPAAQDPVEPAPANEPATDQPPAEEPAAEPSDEPAAGSDEPVPTEPTAPVITKRENPVPIAPEVTSSAGGETAAQQSATLDDAPAAPPAVTQSVNEAGNPVVTTEQFVSEFEVALSIAGSDSEAKMNYAGLVDALVSAAEKVGISLEPRQIMANPMGEGTAGWSPGSNLGFSQWSVTLQLPAIQSDKIANQFQQDVGSEPVWLSSSEIKSRVASQMVNRAIAAMVASLLFIVGYIWFRFQKVAFGVAAVVALIHDVLVTLGAIAVSYWLAGIFGFLLIEQFKISLTVVAALLTIVGYSLNDTIVVFDRIRETRGKSPRLTADMINSSINVTLSRTLLTSITTLIVVVLLYFFGGAGIHAFAFALVVGVVVGTYSSVFIASPILLWMVNRNAPATR